ncbi:hypothetical protein GG804_25080 [Sphingomonas histidinilytica]|uniref:hypothetical protein n=1 Tax=Rhizorhabdus histidinilytica TaxID=439228 RepID=UPI001ADC6501|nr:hypothetical protein [Rhizorhabdus histidinilytica]MBO9380046.1 hypothetical protein [Rhizorhabdus histidinilytica]
MSGYVRLYRSLLGHAHFRNDAEAMAFAWMIARAAWKPTRVRYKARAVMLDRGQLCISQRDMATALDRDKGWVERLWRRLLERDMIEARREAAAMLITICNYDAFQPSGGDREAVPEAAKKADPRQTQGTEQIRERKEEDYSVPNGTGTVVPHPAADFAKIVFDSGVALLTSSGFTDRNARSVIGRWRKKVSDPEMLIILRQAEIEQPSEPVEWIAAAVELRHERRKPINDTRSGASLLERLRADDAAAGLA